MTNNLDSYRSVWVIDTEFQQPDGEPNTPVCLCAEELHSGCRLEFFFDQTHENPFDYQNSLFVCYTASAEWKTFIALGWELPPNVLDLSFEFLNLINASNSQAQRALHGLSQLVHVASQTDSNVEGKKWGRYGRDTRCYLRLPISRPGSLELIETKFPRSSRVLLNRLLVRPRI